MPELPKNMEMLDLVVKHLTGETTSKEQTILTNWLDENPEHLEIYNSYQKVWEGIGKNKGPVNEEIESEWERLEAAINHSNKKVIPIDREKKSWRGMLRIAATITLIITAVSIIFWMNNRLEYIEIIAIDQSMNHVLPDGSIVSLNHHSSLTYRDDFGDNSRTLKLSGEAFFDVKRDINRPFIIQSGNLKVEVLGTSFNVNAYPEDSNIEVIVLSGQVKVSLEDKGKNAVKLEPGNKAVYIKSNQQLSKSSNLDPNFLAWKTKHIIFEETTLEDAITVLTKAYNKQIVLSTYELNHCPITVTFEDQSLESVLNVIGSVLDITSEKSGNQFILSGKGCNAE